MRGHVRALKAATRRRTPKIATQSLYFSSNVLELYKQKFEEFSPDR